MVNEEVETTHVRFLLGVNQLEALDAVAAARRIPRAQLLRTLIEDGCNAPDHVLKVRRQSPDHPNGFAIYNARKRATKAAQ